MTFWFHLKATGNETQETRVFFSSQFNRFESTKQKHELFKPNHSEGIHNCTITAMDMKLFSFFTEDESRPGNVEDLKGF